MRRFYISDLHLFHKDIIKICNRPFSTIEDMHNDIITKWNKKVKRNDTVYILGDIGSPRTRNDIKKLASMMNTLNGKKVLIIGNHDRDSITDLNFRKCFYDIKEYHRAFDNNRKVVMFHYPIEKWEGSGKNVIHLHGHTHNEYLPSKKNRFNVCADVLDYEPKTLDELIALNN